MRNLSPYFNNELSEAESYQITKTLLTNHFERQLKVAYKKELADKYDIAMPTPKKQKRFFLANRKWMAAASVLFFVVGSLMFLFLNTDNIQNQQLSLQTMVDKQLSEHEAHVGVRKSPSEISTLDTEAERNAAIINYTLKDYKSAIPSFNKVLLANQGTIEDHFYLGISYLKEDQPEQAIPVFQKATTLPTTNNFSDVDVIYWYLSLAYIKNNQLDLAAVELNKLVDENRLRDNSKAIELLEVIGKLKSY